MSYIGTACQYLCLNKKLDFDLDLNILWNIRLKQFSECSIDSEESDYLAFERESSMRKSFHENRKQSNSPPAKFFNMYDAYRKKKNGKFIDIVI